MILSILTPIEDVMTWALTHLHQAGLPWAWSVVVLTVIVRMLILPLTIRQIRSMQHLQAHAPEMKAIQQRYKGDRQKLNEELTKFYKENDINPAASCLPIVAQIPVFFSLYFVLRDFEKEILPKFPASDLGWLNVVPNITAPANSHWSGYLLLAIYAISQTSSTLLMSTTMDRMQRTLMLLLPLFFLLFILNFPAGLVLYWVTTNLWTVGQGLVTRRLVPKKEAAPAQKRSSRTPPRAEAAPAPAKEAPRPQAQPRRVKRKKRSRR